MSPYFSHTTSAHPQKNPQIVKHPTHFKGLKVTLGTMGLCKAFKCFIYSESDSFLEVEHPRVCSTNSCGSVVMNWNHLAQMKLNWC